MISSRYNLLAVFLVFVVVGVLAVGAPAGAQVVSADDPNFGPGSITIDLATGYHWLDLTLSTNRSIADVSTQFGAGGDFEGFRYATQAEVTAFWQSAGLSIGFGFPSGPYQAFMDLVGQTDLLSVDRDRTVGFVSTQLAPGQHFAPDAGTFLPPTAFSGFANPNNCCAPDTLATPQAGSYLVRVPNNTIAADFFLHGSGATANPATLFLDSDPPTATTAKYKDSASINFNGGNPWKEVGTWSADPDLTDGLLAGLSQLHVWLGLKNSDDQGTRFDLRADVYKNAELVATGLTRCITGITRNANQAKEVTVSFDPFTPADFNGETDSLKLTVHTRIGTNPNDTKCGGHNNAVGLRLYFDAVSRASQFGAVAP